MGHPKDRAENRMKRRGDRRKNHDPLLKLAQDEITRAPRKPKRIEISALNQAQAAYINSIQVNTITFGVGPAGTGKTWLAAMLAAGALASGQIEKIIVTRPAVEAEGENLGFLPGELEEKIEPYFRPVREAFEEFFGSGHLEYLIKAGVIEARPLAFLRGATFKNCWVLLDEAQNVTPGQMKLFLTRIGENAKLVIDGDLRQKDIPGPSGLADGIRRLKHMKPVGVVEFTKADVVRSGLCQDIVEAYEEPELTSCSPPENRYSTDESNSARSGLERFLG